MDFLGLKLVRQKDQIQDNPDHGITHDITFHKVVLKPNRRKPNHSQPTIVLHSTLGVGNIILHDRQKSSVKYSEGTEDFSGDDEGDMEMVDMETLEEADGFRDEEADIFKLDREGYVYAFIETNPESPLSTRPVARGI